MLPKKCTFRLEIMLKTTLMSYKNILISLTTPFEGLTNEEVIHKINKLGKCVSFVYSQRMPHRRMIVKFENPVRNNAHILPSTWLCI